MSKYLREQYEAGGIKGRRVYVTEIDRAKSLNPSQKPKKGQTLKYSGQTLTIV